jgi:hypothetical protein
MEQCVESSPALLRSWRNAGVSVEQLLADHEVIGGGTAIPDTTLFELSCDTDGIVNFWRGLRLDALNRKEEARAEMQQSYALRAKDDWQSLFYLTLINVDLRDISQAHRYAQELLDSFPRFPLRRDLEQLVEKASQCLEAQP